MTLCAIALDFDGVIVESTDIKTEAFRRLFADRGADVADTAVAHHLSNEGVSRYAKFRHMFEDVLGEPYSERIEAGLDRQFSEHVLEAIVECPFVPGALSFLQEYSHVVPLHVVSGTPDEELGRIVEARGLTSYFTSVLGSSEAKADHLRHIASRQGILTSQVLMVGDAMSDWQGAIDAGSRFVVRLRARQTDSFPEEGVDASVADLADLAQLLRDCTVSALAIERSG